MTYSKSYENLKNRFAEIEQILEAHSALTRLRSAEDKVKDAGGDVKKVLDALKVLVDDPGRGKPKQVHALNSAAIALLSAHLQGYIVEIYNESSKALLSGKVSSVDSIQEVAPTKGNPNTHNITKLFNTLGIPDVLSGISWQKVSNASLRKKLNDFTTLRNSIVHGRSDPITKAVVQNYFESWKLFTEKFDKKMKTYLKSLLGNDPW